MALYIHYGSANFNPRYFEQVTNRDQVQVKPDGGLWASRVDAKFGWCDLCERQGLWLESLDSYFRFQITPAAKVAHLYASKDLDRLPRRNDCFDRVGNEFYLDFEQMVKDGWDAIELHLSSTDKNWCTDGLYGRLFGWDCDSILIMNPKIISPLTHI